MNKFSKNKNFEIILLEKALYPLALLMLYTGTSGIIENNSPDSLATISTLGQSFFTYIQYHSLILSGSIALTFAVWLSAHHH